MKTEFVSMAERLGARLCRDAIWSGNQCNWTADCLEHGVKGYRALTGAFYDGTSGIALFLHRLSEITGERIFSLTAQAALRQALTNISRLGTGFYAGSLGVLFAQLQIRGDIDVDDLLHRAARHPDDLDLMYGSAGAIAVLLSAFTKTRDQPLIEAALHHGDLLLEQAQNTSAGLSWVTFKDRPPLTGFSHGAAGIAWALLELFRVTSEIRFREAALSAFAYEQSVFDAERGNWPDFRSESTGFMNAWCHGAAGISLSRLRAWTILQANEWRTQAEIALATVQKETSSMENCSLCHGVAGNADILITASVGLDRPDLLRTAEQLGAEAFDRFEKRRLPWPCGLPDAGELPDLMLGLAGIGLFYLRLAEPAIPSPLLPL